jgi:hypothetical protein
VADRICLIRDCDRQMVYTTKGLCKHHYSKALYGPTSTAIRRFEKRIADENGCWRWTARLNPKGYGVFYLGRKGLAAHRWSYEYHRAPIPEGLVIDHLCRNRACVNPWHMEPVTSAVNTQRGYWGTRTECIRGHTYTPETSRVRRDGSRWCRTCHHITKRARRAAKLAALAS